MKRKRLEEDEEDLLIKKIKNTSNSFQKKFISNSTSRTNKKITSELKDHEKFILEVFIDSMDQNKMKIFQYICEEHPKLIPENILFQINFVKNFEMLDFLFEKKFTSKDVLEYENNLLIHFVSKNHIIIAEYLIKVQHFDLNFKTKKTGNTGKFVEHLHNSIFGSSEKREFENGKDDSRVQFH
jgi:hypothetical protein